MRANSSLKMWLTLCSFCFVMLMMSCNEDDDDSTEASPTANSVSADPSTFNNQEDVEWTETDMSTVDPLLDNNSIFRTATTAVAPNMIRAGSGRCLDNSSGGTANGNKIQEWDCVGNGNQTWYLKKGPMVSSYSGKCMDVANGNTANGTKIQLWDCQSGNTNQQFNYVNGTIQFSKATNKCVDVSGGGTANGTKIQLYDCNGSNAQQWAFIDGALRSGLDSKKCLSLAGTDLYVDSANGSQLQLYSCTGTSSQIWSPTNMSIVNANGKCIDVAGDSSVNGTKVQLYSCNNTAAQLWTWSKNDLKALGKCLDISNSGTANGTQVQIWSCDSGTFAQNWYTNQGTSPTNVPFPPLNTTPASVLGDCRVGGVCSRKAIDESMGKPENKYAAHSGTDYQTTDANVAMAICDGTVKLVRNPDKYDLWQVVTIIQHKNCAGYPILYAYYGHINSWVSAGQTVIRGQQIGTVAYWNSDGETTHLHFGLSTAYYTECWGYPSTDVATEDDGCTSDNLRRDHLLNYINASSCSSKWIDSYSFARSYNWWNKAISVSSCN